MSADNFIGVYKHSDGRYRVGMQSCPLLENIDYENLSADKRIAKLDEAFAFCPAYETRAQALIAAHDALHQEVIVEYGILEI